MGMQEDDALEGALREINDKERSRGRKPFILGDTPGVFDGQRVWRLDSSQELDEQILPVNDKTTKVISTYVFYFTTDTQQEYEYTYTVTRTGTYTPDNPGNKLAFIGEVTYSLTKRPKNHDEENAANPTAASMQEKIYAVAHANPAQLLNSPAFVKAKPVKPPETEVT